jgi:hypothetical protein
VTAAREAEPADDDGEQEHDGGQGTTRITAHRWGLFPGEKAAHSTKKGPTAQSTAAPIDV